MAFPVTAPFREKELQKNPQIFLELKKRNIISAMHGQSKAEAILNSSAYTRTISGVISAMLCAPHICMVSASSPASLSM